MSEELQQKLRDQLWEVANKLRGIMSASDFRRPLKNGSDNNSLPFQDHFCLKKGNY